MDIKVLRKNVLVHRTPCIVLGRFEGRSEDALLNKVDKALGGVISAALKSGDFKARKKQTLTIYTNGKISPERVLVVGLGSRREFTLETLRESAGIAANAVKKMKLKAMSTALPQAVADIFSFDEIGQAVAEGSALALYSFDDYKTEKKGKPKKVTQVNLILPPRHRRAKALALGTERGRLISEAVCFSRDLISQPGNVATPTYLAEASKKMAKKLKLKLKLDILEKSDMETLKMGALLGVSGGSSQPPKFIVLEYKGGKPKARPCVFVGKAVTFDSGGISIKPSAGMEEMKTDMSGGAAALGAVMAAAALKLSVNVVALVPATENLPGGKAYKPGDILTSMSGQTIEVQNTDAEGRLILADALTYAERYKPSAVIDLATLTGACVVALGSHATGLMGNNEGLKKKVQKAGEETGERLWELPLWEPYKEQIKSDIADMKNVGGKEAGTITAAAFLDRFASKFHWAHLDIAGTAWETKGRNYRPKGAVGVGVRLLVKFLENEING